MTSALDVMQAVHGRFSSADPQLPNGFAEHAPMGADALLALGVEPDAVAAWAARHDPAPLAPDSPVAVERDRLVAVLAATPWADVVAAEVPALVPHLGAHLFHGLIRTAHAVRALTRHDGDAGRRELATGLAAWRVWAGTGAVDGTGDRTAPAGDDDPLAAVLDAARRGAHAHLAGPSIVTIHAVTAPMAYLLLAPLLGADTHQRAAAAFARTHARYGAPAAERSPLPPPPASMFASLAERWDAHPAKLVEAAVRAHAASGDAVFLHVVAAMMGPWSTTEHGG